MCELFVLANGHTVGRTSVEVSQAVVDYFHSCHYRKSNHPTPVYDVCQSAFTPQFRFQTTSRAPGVLELLLPLTILGRLAFHVSMSNPHKVMKEK